MLVEWTGDRWIHNDVPDFVATVKEPNGSVRQVPPNNKAFFMTWEQEARLFAPQMADGPFPEHYEPFESPTKNLLNGRENSPTIQFSTLPGVNRGTRRRIPDRCHELLHYGALAVRYPDQKPFRGW